MNTKNEVRNIQRSEGGMSFSSNGKCRDIYWPLPFNCVVSMHSHNAKVAK